MTDIDSAVEREALTKRLRDGCAYLPERLGGCDQIDEAATDVLLDQAADEIDRLSARADEAERERDEARTALRDLVMLHAQDDIGCVPPPARAQWDDAWREAENIVRVEP